MSTQLSIVFPVSTNFRKSADPPYAACPSMCISARRWSSVGMYTRPLGSLRMEKGSQTVSLEFAQKGICQAKRFVSATRWVCLYPRSRKSAGSRLYSNTSYQVACFHTRSFGTLRQNVAQQAITVHEHSLVVEPYAMIFAAKIRRTIHHFE